MTVEPTELKTKRFLLRPFKGQDVDDVLAYANDEEWAWFLPHIPQPYTRIHAEQFVAQAVLRSWNDNVSMAIELSGSVVGSVGMSISVRNSLGALGYSLARKHCRVRHARGSAPLPKSSAHQCRCCLPVTRLQAPGSRRRNPAEASGGA